LKPVAAVADDTCGSLLPVAPAGLENGAQCYPFAAHSDTLHAVMVDDKLRLQFLDGDALAKKSWCFRES